MTPKASKRGCREDEIGFVTPKASKRASTIHLGLPEEELTLKRMGGRRHKT